MTAPTTALSPREVQVLALVCADLTDREIAARLGVGEGAVGMYISRARSKLGIELPTRGAFWRERVKELGL